MTAANLVYQHIESIPKGEPFLAAALRHYASPDNIRQILNRLVKKNVIMRIAHGVFVRPKESSYIGTVLPEPEQVAKAIALSSNEIIAIHGAEAARRLGLSTQTPVQPVFNTTGNTRRIKYGNTVITLKHISPKKIVAPGTTTGLVISALWYLGKENVSTATIQTIKARIGHDEFMKLFKAIEYMPAWMAKALISTQQGHLDA